MFALRQRLCSFFIFGNCPRRSPRLAHALARRACQVKQTCLSKFSRCLRVWRAARRNVLFNCSKYNQVFQRRAIYIDSTAGWQALTRRIDLNASRSPEDTTHKSLGTYVPARAAGAARLARRGGGLMKTGSARLHSRRRGECDHS